MGAMNVNQPPACTVHNRTVSSVNSFSFNACIISNDFKLSDFNEYDLRETAGNDPTSVAEVPLIYPDFPLTITTALTTLFQVTVKISQAGDRSLPYFMPQRWFEFSDTSHYKR